MRHSQGRPRQDIPAQVGRQTTALALALMLIATVGCGGGGSGSASSSGPAALVIEAPSSVTGSATNGLDFTFSEALTTISGEPEVTYTLHEVNNGPTPVTVSAGQDAATHAVFLHMTVLLLDPQGHPLTLPTVTPTQTLTLNPGDTADADLTLNLAYFTEAGRYTASVTADGTQGVPSLTTPLVLSAD